MHLIGINGLKTSGKDTTGKIVQAIYGDGNANVVRAGFADKLKIMAAAALGFEGTPTELIALMDEAKEHWIFNVSRYGTASLHAPDPSRLSPGWTTLEPIKQLTGRQYLQWFGGNARKVFGDTFWIDQVLPRPQPFDPTTPRLDPRDAEMLAVGVANVNSAKLRARYPDADAVVITDVRYANEAERVKALGGVVWEVLRPGLESDGHSSEVPLPPELVDWQIHNVGTIRDLEERVEDAMTETLR